MSQIQFIQRSAVAGAARIGSDGDFHEKSTTTTTVSHGQDKVK
jgi:hypothetical protein